MIVVFPTAIARLGKDEMQEIRAATAMEQLPRFDHSVTFVALIE